MKTKEELNALKEEVEAMSKKLRELTDEEMAQVTGGHINYYYCSKCDLRVLAPAKSGGAVKCFKCGGWVMPIKEEWN